MNLIKVYSSILNLLIVLCILCVDSLWAHENKITQANDIHEFNERGPNGGRLFKEGNVTLELLLFERGMPPHFRAYLYDSGRLIAPDNTTLTLQLNRFNNKKDEVAFIPVGYFLQSKQTIPEPHSFDVAIQLKLQGKQFNWSYSAYEGRVKIATEMLKAADIQIATAQKQIIKTQLNVVGKIAPNRDALIPIYARYTGIIKKMTKNLGDTVSKGETLVTVESNESLQDYTITAPMSGTIVQKYATNGELAQNTKPIYEVANLDTVWADFTLYRKEAPLVSQGMEIIVSGDDGKPSSVGLISYIAPLGIEDSQTTLARTILSNQNHIWLPGMYVNGKITIKEQSVPVAVLVSAIQKINGKDVVFAQQDDYFEATPVILGKKDKLWVEIISGLDSGQHYVSKNSFFIKAELGKEGASHEH